MDPRVPVQTRADGTTFALGMKFASRDEAEREIGKLIAHREALAGRPLTGRELRDGITRTDARTERERIADAQWSPKMARTPVADDNPFRASEDDEPVSTREGLRRKSERAWDERKAKQKDRTSPQRLAAIQEATELLELVKYEPGMTAADVAYAENILRQAQVGTLDHYRSMVSAFTETRLTRYSDQAAKIQDDIAQRQAELAATQQRITTLRPQPQQQPEPPAERRVFNADSVYTRVNDRIVEIAGSDIHYHDPSDADHRIVAAAGEPN